MQNGYSTETGESASLSRRAFVSLAASSAALTVPTVAIAEGVVQSPVFEFSGASALKRLIDADAEAKLSVVTLYNHVASLEDNAELRSVPHPKVRYSWLVRGWIDDETGERPKDPLYAYSNEQILEICEKERANWLWRIGAPATDEQKAAVHKSCDERIARLQSELAALQLAKRQVADRIGLTAAEEAAKAASDRQKASAEKIAQHVPATLVEAGLLSNWLLAEEDCLNDEELVLRVLANIAKAGGFEAGRH